MDNPFRNLHGPALWAVIAGSAGILGFMEYRHHKTTGSWNPFAKPAAAPDAIDPVTGMPVSQDTAIDPQTGLPYLAEAQQYGSVQAAEAAMSALGQTSGTGTGIPVNPAYPSGNGASTTVGTGYTSNSAWAQAATAGLADTGFSQTDVATALGDYLTSTPVTPDQKKLIDIALAEYGNPPIGNFQVILIPPGKTGKTLVTVPDVIGDPQADAFSALSALGLAPHGSRTVKGEILIVRTQEPAAGTRVTPGTTVKLTATPDTDGKPRKPPGPWNPHAHG